MRVVLTRSGLPNVEIEGRPYHSPYDPIREADRFLSSAKVEDADVVLCFGWGLGYSADALLRRLRPSARVYVFEPDGELFELFRSSGNQVKAPLDSRFRFVVGPDISRFLEDWDFDGCQESDRFLWLVWPCAAELHPQQLAALQARVRDRIRDRAANLITHFQNGATYFEQTVANYVRTGDPSVGSLFGKLSGVPLVMVSAGPSLDRNIRELRGAASRCFILAVDTALRPLLAAGVVPHAVIAADPTELNAAHVAGAIPPATFLIAEQAVHPSVFHAARRRFVYSVGVFPDSLFRKFGVARDRLAVAGSVATAALDLACRMGANPIIFAGQDFSYSWDRDYAHNTIFDGNLFDVKKVANAEATDIWGRRVPTTENLLAYREFFIRRIRQKRDVRFINATEGGILSEGVEVLSLRDALHQSATCRLEAQFVLEQNHRSEPVSSDPLRHLLDVLRKRASDCGCLHGFLDLVAKRAVIENDKDDLTSRIEWGISILEALPTV